MLLMKDFVRFLILVLACASSAYAQFQAPTADELKMTADPKYPDAAAVVLNYEKKTDNLVGYESVYARIKILKESAKELATVNLEYPKSEGFEGIAAIQGRTVHADGTIIPLDMKPQDLTEVKTANGEVRRTVFNLPSVEVGSIIEYYYQVRIKQHQALDEGYWLINVDWDVQRRYPIRAEHFLYQPIRQVVGNSLLWYTNLPGAQKLKPDAAGRFELSLQDVPPLAEEKWAPPIASRRYRVLFYFSSAMSEKQYWDASAKDWLKDVNRFAEPNATLKQAVAGMISPSDSDLDRAKKIYAAVQALDNTDFSRKKTEAERKREGLKTTKHAEDVWNEKSGDSQEITLLYLAMLKAAGLKAYPMLVVNRDRGIFNPDYLVFRSVRRRCGCSEHGGRQGGCARSRGEDVPVPDGELETRRRWGNTGDGIRRGAVGDAAAGVFSERGGAARGVDGEPRWIGRWQAAIRDGWAGSAALEATGAASG